MGFFKNIAQNISPNTGSSPVNPKVHGWGVGSAIGMPWGTKAFENPQDTMRNPLGAVMQPFNKFSNMGKNLFGGRGGILGAMGGRGGNTFSYMGGFGSNGYNQGDMSGFSDWMKGMYGQNQGQKPFESMNFLNSGGDWLNSGTGNWKV